MQHYSQQELISIGIAHCRADLKSVIDAAKLAYKDKIEDSVSDNDPR